MAVNADGPHFYNLADLVPAVVYTAAADESGSTLYVNDHIEAMLGFSAAAWMADPTLWSRQVHEEDRQRIVHAYSSLTLGQPPTSYEYRIRRRDGREIWVRDYVRIIRAPLMELPIFQGVMVDITQEKQFAAKQRDSEARYRKLFEANPNPMWIYDLDSLRFVAVNDAAMAHYGYGRDEFLAMRITDIRPPEDVPRLRENLAAVTEGVDEAGLWRHVRKDGSVIDVEITSHTLDYDGRRAEAVSARDVTEQRRAQAQVAHYIGRIEGAILNTADAVSQIVELRDPYTAGHERRVGDLAVAIAAEMGLGDDMQRGLRVAGALHDVGKIAVPSEILSKPTRLSKAEFDLIKAHPQAGYEVLKGIDFPWPVAEVAHQHHERMDGSGYPQGLKGDAIILEARITAVADVIEAINSHRPYRPGLGIDVALREIRDHRGSGFDPPVVDAALALFARGYRLPD